MIIIAYMKQAKTEDELKGVTLTNLRKEYIKLAEDYNKLMNLDVIYCPICGTFKASSQFYSSKKTKSGFNHCGCKECLLNLATDIDNKTKVRTDNREKTIEVFKMLDLPFVDSVYKSQLQLLADNVAEKQRSTAYAQLLTLVKSLPQYYDKTFANSEFDYDGDILGLSTNRKPRKEIIKLFGSGFTTEDYLYLQDQYDDWKSRVQIDTKPQETYLVQVCFILLDIFKARKNGKDPDKLVKSLNEALQAANWQPRQNVSNTSSDTLTFGQLIEKWEQEEAIPPVDPDLEDLDNMKTYIDVFFKGHLAKMMGLKNAYSQEYDDYMEQYTVNKPQYDDDDVSDAIYSTLFGKEVE